MVWSSDDPELCATREKSDIHILRRGQSTERHASTAHLCSFSDLEVQVNALLCLVDTDSRLELASSIQELGPAWPVMQGIQALTHLLAAAALTVCAWCRECSWRSYSKHAEQARKQSLGDYTRHKQSKTESRL